MAPRSKSNPHGLGGEQRALGPTSTLVIVHLRPTRASKELKYWLSWSQDFTALTPSVKWSLHFQGHFVLS